MEILQTAKNGTVTRAIKTADELTAEERAWFEKYRFESADNGTTFDVQYTKQGVLRFVEVKTRTEVGEKKFNEQTASANRFMTSLTAMYGSGRKAGRARKALGVTRGGVQAAARAFIN